MKKNFLKVSPLQYDYFKVWSSNMAYTLGLWFAKGSISNGKIFDITIKAKDKFILKQISKELGYTNKLYDGIDKQSARINFSCKVIYDDIVSLGGCEKVINFPDIPNEYQKDFIRGYFDGNGSIMQIKHNRLNSAFICGSKKFLDKLLEVLKTEAGIEGGSYDPSSYTLRFGTKDTIRLGEYMYKNNPELFLKRKKDKFIL